MEVNIKYTGNYSKINLYGDYDILRKLVKVIGYQNPNYMYTQAFKDYGWNGWTSFITGKNFSAPYGAIDGIIQYLNSIKVKYTIDEELKPDFRDFSFLDNLKMNINNLPVEIRDYQINAVKYAIQANRSVIVSATGSGKTMMLYLLCSYYLKYNIPVIIIVPTIELCRQGVSDLKSYGYDEEINAIYSGQEKLSSKITFTTYQSLVKYLYLLNDYGALILDECHKVKSKSMKKILTSAKNIKYRIGMTGSLKEGSEEQAVAMYYIGVPYTFTKSIDLMDKDILAKLHVIAVRFRYNKEINLDLLSSFYKEEVNFLNLSIKRNQKIVEIAAGFNKTGIILVNEIKHCQLLYKIAKEIYPDRNIYQIRGGYNERNDELFKTFNELKPLIEKEENAIIIAGIKVFSTGISIKNLHFGIMGISTKSYTTLIQSIGRGLRVNENKKDFYFIDIVDDFRMQENDNHYSINHFKEREKYYEEQGFLIQKQTINLF